MEEDEEKSNDPSNYYGSIICEVNMGKSANTSAILKIMNAIMRIFLNIIFYGAVVWIVMEGGKFAYNFSYQLFGSVPVTEEPGKDYDFLIAKGDSTMQIAEKLEFSNLIVNKYSFYLKTKFKKYNIYPGTYVLNNSMDYDEILDVITDQKNSIVNEGDGQGVNSDLTGDKKDSTNELTPIPNADIP